jgi:hypothetical protein
MQPPSGYAAASLVELLPMLIKAPDLAYLEDTMSAVRLVLNVLKEAQVEPVSNGMLAIVQVRGRHLVCFQYHLLLAATHLPCVVIISYSTLLAGCRSFLCNPCCCMRLQELVHQHSVFKLLGQASSRALQLMLTATNKERNKPTMLKSFMQLQLLLPSFISAWGYSTGDLAAEEAAAAKQLALQQLQETGEALA